MIVELEFDARVEVRFYFSRLPASLMTALGERRQELLDSTGMIQYYGATGTCEVEAEGRRFLVFVRLGDTHTAEGGEDVQVVRVVHILENTASET